jgi:uncharacterized protein YkwD
MKNRLAPIFAITILLIGLSAFFLINSASSKHTEIVSIPSITPTAQPELNNINLWLAINEWRKSVNLATYTESKLLCDVADIRIKEIQTNFSHDGLFSHRWCDEKLTCTISENIAAYSPSVNETLQGWLNSPPHRKALESDYSHSCIRTQNGYSVQIFGYY